MDNIEIKEYIVSTVSLVLHGFGLLNLINGEFTTFILLITSAFYTDLALRKVFNTKTTELWYEKYFIRLSEWVRLISLFFIFTEIYKDKLNIFHLALLIFVLLGANIRYTLNAQINIQNGKEVENGIKIWNKLIFKNEVSIDKLEEIKKYTFPFKQRLMPIYFIILMIFIYI